MSDALIKHRYLPGYNDPKLELYNANRHRDNMEYLLEMQGAELSQIQAVLYDGFRHSLQNQLEIRQQLQSTEQTFKVGVAQINAALDDVNSSIRNGLEAVAEGVTRQIELHQQSYNVLQDILGTLKTPRATEAGEWARLAADNMRQALNMTNESRSKRLLDEAVELLEKALEIHDFDAKAHFDYAWLCRNYLNRPEAARKHFDTAALRAMGHEKCFAVFALRSAASVCHDLGDHAAALEAIEEARTLSEEPSSRLELEYAKCLIASGQIANAIDILRPAIARDPIQYYQVLVQDDLSSDSGVLNLLSNLNEDELERGGALVKQAIDEFEALCDFLTAEARAEFVSNVEAESRSGHAKPFHEIASFYRSLESDIRDRAARIRDDERARITLAKKRKEEDENRKRDAAERERTRKEKEEQEAEEAAAAARARKKKLILVSALSGLVIVVLRMHWLSCELVLADRSADDVLRGYNADTPLQGWGVMFGSLVGGAISGVVAACCFDGADGPAPVLFGLFAVGGALAGVGAFLQVFFVPLYYFVTAIPDRPGELVSRFFFF